MLEEARKRAAEGINVLVGYAEPHIRSETEALLLGMEILPYLVVGQRAGGVKEFDLDEALRRKPQILLVDELAHSNGPGLRHQKRWQDVAELLDAGIDVFTTLNVHHLESINDVVERITGQPVRETLPDSVLEQADELELIDTAPDELLERLAEGKVDWPGMPADAVQRFFNKGTLIALRELALRKTADRVDHQMQDYRGANAVQTTWAATERILVCVSTSPLSARLVPRGQASGVGPQSGVDRRVRRDAPRRIAPPGGPGARFADASAGAAARRGGGHAQRAEPAEELVDYARARNVTKIVIGKPRRPRWRELLSGSLVDELIRRSGQIDVYVIRDDPSEAPPGRHRQSRDESSGSLTSGRWGRWGSRPRSHGPCSRCSSCRI